MRRVLLLLVVLTACSGGGGDVSKFCSTVEHAHDLVGRDTSTASYDELQQSIREVHQVQRDLQADAPKSIRDEIAALFAVDSDTIRVSEQERLADARAKVDDFVRERCDLDFPL